MVFILLIFFIVTTVFVEETGVEVNKPEAAAA
ncbi:MAG: biopolymer transporter ExbD, partial [Puniceicoccaceae bacterium]|nr:biopolymer transporter ExbD [Puniceicoccaceae bacterium]